MSRSTLLSILPATVPAAAADIGQAGSWSDDLKAMVAQGCRQTMLHDALEAYRGAHGLRRTQLPKDLKQRLEDQMVGQLAVCDCVTANAAERWGFASFMREQSNLATEIAEYVRSGACRPGTADTLQ